jgi:hypothetical protein
VSPEYHYDPTQHIQGSQLREELLAEVPAELWSTYKGMTPEDHVGGIVPDRGFAPCTLEQLIYLCQNTATQIIGAPHMNCNRYVYLTVGEMYWFTNARGGGTLAFGGISGLDLFGHTSRHRIVIARMVWGGWLMADAAFATNPNLSQWITGVHGGSLSELEVV